MTRRSLTVAGSCVLAILLPALASTPAHATGLAVCAGTETTTYTPGLKLTAREVAVDQERTFTCASSDPGAASGHISDPFLYTSSCLSLPHNDTGFDLTIVWADATTSTWSITSSVSTVVAGQLVFTTSGTITAGKFAGEPVNGVAADVAPSLLDCLSTSGLTSMSGVLNIDVT
ncbi:MAG TPA: hypothetical protein VI318_10425 [Baekduia sp.]